MPEFLVLTFVIAALVVAFLIRVGIVMSRDAEPDGPAWFCQWGSHLWDTDPFNARFDVCRRCGDRRRVV